MSQQKPQLSPQATEINQKLIALIKRRIEENQGAISFAEYMQLALYAPQLGYYQNELLTFGAKGDFVTAPEMGGLFADCLANSIGSLDKDLTANILEIGAGSGKLAADLLCQLNDKNRMPEHYFILEPSASLQSLQYETIKQQTPDLLSRVSWLTGLPKNLNGVIIANEVVDAIPCNRIQNTNDGWKYLGVTCGENNSFVYQLTQLVKTTDLPPILIEQSYPENYITELRPWTKGWVQGLANSLEAGAILLFDYGYPQLEYYHPQRIEGSLQCFSRHTSQDNPFELVGLQDITAHVDFTQIAQVAHDNGMDIDGFTTQAGFLLENGILDQTELSNSSANYAISQQIQKLTSPGQMGELVKVIGLSKNINSQPRGFTLQNQLHRL